MLVGQLDKSACLNFTGLVGACVNRLQKHFVLVSLSCSVPYVRTWLAAYLYEQAESRLCNCGAAFRDSLSVKLKRLLF